MNLILLVFLSFSALAHQWSEVEERIQKAISNRVLPGGVLLVGTRDEILYHEAFGVKGDGPTPNSTETIYDLASLTKVVATATSVMMLEERGLLSLSDKVVKYFPEFVGANKASVTVEDLLRHHAGPPRGHAQLLVRLIRTILKEFWGCLCSIGLSQRLFTQI